MTLLVLGVALWSAAHLFKRLAPGARASMGEAGKGVVAVLVVAGVVMMVLGYRGAEFRNLYFPPAWTVHLNNTLMLIAVGLFGVAHSKSRLRARMRHPMLMGMLTWAVAHLLVNGDLASLILFGGLGLWAVAEMLIINARDKAYTPWQGGSMAGDIRLAVITLVVFGAIAGMHAWIGPWPFPGGA
ncbi:MAG: NnrU family protein [Paracoccaceae bacterium]